MAERQLNEKDKKLVWSLEEALKKKKELGQEGEVNLEKDIKVKQVDTSKDVLVYEVIFRIIIKSCYYFTFLNFSMRLKKTQSRS